MPVDDSRVADIRNVLPGDKAPNGQGELRLLRGIEVGHIFQLGTIYSEAMQATFLDRDGQGSVPIMGCYGMGITRLVGRRHRTESRRPRHLLAGADGAVRCAYRCAELRQVGSGARGRG